MAGADHFSRHTHRLRGDHTWQAPPGFAVAVLDKGAVRFNVPRDWIAIPESGVLNFYDRQTPDDTCRLGASYLRLPSGVDWSGVPLAGLLENATRNDPERRPLGQTVRVERPDIELAWAEYHFEDPKEHREARSRIAVARGRDLQALLTFDYWPEDARRLEPVWTEVVRSVELGRYVENPILGDDVQ